MPAGGNAGGRSAVSSAAPRTYADAERETEAMYVEARSLNDRASVLRAQAAGQNARTKAGKAERARLSAEAARAESQAEGLIMRGFLNVRDFRKVS